MQLTPDIDQWLVDAGYQYHCFISWPHTRNKDISDCAIRLKEAIEQSLALSIPNPRVFLDDSEITGGSIWKRNLRNALCKSISMVAICAPIYYHPSHFWCGLEWAAMHFLTLERLPDSDFSAIIPVLLKKDEFLPTCVSEIQYIDFSRILITGRNYYRTNHYRQKIQEIIQRIENIASTIANHNRLLDCDHFDIPEKSAFENYQKYTQPFPFRKEKNGN